MGSLKKKLKKHLPGIAMKVLGQKEEDADESAKRQEAREGAAAGASRGEQEAQRLAAEAEYAGLEGTLSKNYADNARRAGTYADTGEFQSGLRSDVSAGLRGARMSQAARINALRKQLGMEDFKAPETQGTQVDPLTFANSTAPTPNAQVLGDPVSAEAPALSEEVPAVQNNAVANVNDNRKAAIKRKLDQDYRK